MWFSSRILIVMVLCVSSFGLSSNFASAKHKRAQLPTDAQPSGVVVESVAPGSPAEKAGLRVGDILQWCGARPLRSAFDFLAARENASGSAITLKGLRAGQPLTASLPIQLPGAQLVSKNPDLLVRPQLPAPLQALYDAGLTSIANGHTEEGVVSWQNAIEAMEKAGDAVGAGWLCWRTGEVYRFQRDWKRTQTWQERAWKNVEKTGDVATQRSVLLALGTAREHQNDLMGAFAWYEQTRKLDAANGNMFWETDDLDHQAHLAITRKDWNEARKLYNSALAICRTLAAVSWQIADALDGLGRADMGQDNYPQAQKNIQAATDILQKHAPDSLGIAIAYADLAVAVFNQNRLPQGIEYSRQALAIYRREEFAPEDQLVILSNMGQAAQSMKDIFQARPYFEEALPLARKYKPQSEILATVLVNLGLIARLSNNFAQAEEYTRESLAIRHRILPDTVDEAESNAQLCIIAADLGKPDEARQFANTALDIYRKRKPESLDMVVPLSTLAVLALKEGYYPLAQSYCKHALAICQLRNPNFPDKASVLDIQSMIEMAQSKAPPVRDDRKISDLYREQAGSPLYLTADLFSRSMAAVERGEWTQAQRYAQLALSLGQQLAPGSPYLKISYALVGYIEMHLKNYTVAPIHFQQMLDLAQKFAPGSMDEADARAFLGHVMLAQHKYEDALKFSKSSADIVEAQRQRIANPENRALLLEQHPVPFLDMMQAQIALNQKEQAFETLERTRARSLIDLISEREPSASIFPLPDAPPETVRLRQISQQRNMLSQKLLAAATISQLSEADTLREQIQALDVEKRKLETAIRQTSPHYANLNYPKPLSFAEARQTLDDGTLLLAYALGEKESYLFAVTRTGIRVITLPVGEEALGRKVAELRGALQFNGNYKMYARWLYQTLVAPARKEIDASQRLLLCPDGVLNTLPFAALVTSPPDKPVTHLVELKPLHVITSLSLYRELRQMPAARSEKILAIADPDYGNDSANANTRNNSHHLHKSETASASIKKHVHFASQTPDGKRGKENQVHAISSLGGAGAVKQGSEVRLPSLPETRQQITALQKLYGQRVEAHVGRQATTAVIRQTGPELAILHLACHGLLNDSDPLSSALALSSGGADHGFLLASDILRLKLSVGLVMLSACDTGLGKQTQFEGVMGLMRAFQYAGAHTVGVSLWKVEPVSTTELMNHFYAEYKAGMSKDVALQQAQIAISHDPQHPDWKHPHYWAAFQMVGDWK